MQHPQKAINHSHPYSSIYRPVCAPTLPTDPMLEAEAQQERQIASADPMARCLDELLAELTKANNNNNNNYSHHHRPCPPATNGVVLAVPASVKPLPCCEFIRQSTFTISTTTRKCSTWCWQTMSSEKIGQTHHLWTRTHTRTHSHAHTH